MKYLKSSAHNLRELFERSITISDVSEPLVSFDAECCAQKTQSFMVSRDYDVVGVREQGLIIGFARRTDLKQGVLKDFSRHFESHDVLPNNTPLLKVFAFLADRPVLFVSFIGKVHGILTKGDMQKAPVRMWLFGLISMIEMQLLRIIRLQHPNELWRDALTPKRLQLAVTLLDERIRRDAGTDLTDCLQFADKREILMKSEGCRRLLGFQSKREGDTLLATLEQIRNALAHSQDLITGHWHDFVATAEKAEILLKNCEEIH